ncbi:MAG TPA: tetratricopeptide repeat protein, partial [Phycisphaerae bacterium]|nr:tetratricopeptide repeat protein [Phycisphaerae bacterium]
GDLDGALADCNKVIELKPDDAHGYDARGMLQLTRGDWDVALDDFNKAIKLNPDDFNAYANRGRIKNELGNPGGAQVDFNRAKELNPDDADEYLVHGVEKQDKGDLDGALADFNKAIELNPKNADVYLCRGHLNYNSHKFADALADFRKFCELNSDDQYRDYAYFYVWLIRARLGEKEAVTKELQAYWNNRETGTPDDWPSRISSFLTGKLAELDFIEAAQNSDDQKDNEQHCEAYFYAGSKRLIAGDKTTATDYFKKCLVTDVKGFSEYQSAAAELHFLRATN